MRKMRQQGFLHKGMSVIEQRLRAREQKRHEARLKKVKSVVRSGTSQAAEKKWHKFRAGRAKAARRKRYGNETLPIIRIDLSLNTQYSII